MADGSSLWRERTAWPRDRAAPVRAFLSTESGSAGVLLAAAVTALVWANLGGSSYEDLWHSSLSIRLGDMQVTHDLRTWINSGLMTFSSSSSAWRRAASSTWATCASAGGSCCPLLPGWREWPCRR